MKKKITKKITENIIINKYLKKLNLNKKGTFNFDNDAAYLNNIKDYKTVITTDTITEKVDFFQNDSPESIAQKLICVNLSDLSAMGSLPKAYTLNLSLTSKINSNWLEKFTNRLSLLQKKYNIYLLGGDISKSQELTFTATFFGQSKLQNILSQNKCAVGDDIWVTGNLGESYLGYKILTNSKLKIAHKLKNNFIKSYYYPKPCMFGISGSKYINAAIDISDGFYGDLKKVLNNSFGASITKKTIPVSRNIKNVIKDNSSIISMNKLLAWGDDYELILIINKKYRNKIKNLAKINNVKLSMVGSIIKEKGIFDDSMNLIKKLSSFDHFR